MSSSFKQTPAKATSSKRKKAFNTPSQKRSSHQSSNVPHPSSSIFSTPEQNANNNMVPEVCMDSVASAKTSFPREQDVETPRRPRIPVPFPDIEDLASPCKPEPSCGPMHVKKEEAPSMSQQIDQELHEEVHVTAQKIGSPDENEARREYVDAVDIREDLGLGRSSEAIPRIDQGVHTTSFVFPNAQLCSRDLMPNSAAIWLLMQITVPRIKTVAPRRCPQAKRKLGEFSRL